MCFNSDEPTVYREGRSRARVAHVCCECAETIPAGALNFVANGRWSDDWREYRRCIRCADDCDAIMRKERSEGCFAEESFVPFGALAEYMADADSLPWMKGER